MRQIRIWQITIAMLLCSLTVNAHNFEVDGIYYNITSSTDLTVEVTYRGNYYDSYTNEYIGEVTIPETITYESKTYHVLTIGNYAFAGCTELSSIFIPGSVSVISSCAFDGCSGLTTVAMSEGLIRVDSWSFRNCRSLVSVIIPNGVTSIGENAFSGCSDLASISISGTVTSIGNNVFEDCTSLRDVIFEDGSAKLSVGYQNYNGEGMFYKCPIETVYLGRVIICTQNGYWYGPFYENKTLISLVVGDKVSSIGEFMFYNTKLSYIDLGKGLKSIGKHAFYSCNISSLEIPNSVTSIDEYAFGYCNNLTSAVIGDGVNTIGKGVFSGCSGLVDLTIGVSVSSVGDGAFSECNNIESIYALNTKAITCDESIFATDAYNNAILYVPSDRVFAYEKATPWNKFQIEPMKKFTVTYMVDGKVYKTIETEYAAEIILPEDPTKDGYTFIGWSEVPKTMPANDITIYGSFAINKYLVTFKIGDEVIASDSLEYGTSIVIPEAPEKEGYTFNGWGEVAKTVPAGDVTYEGNYSVNSYKLTFIVDGEVVQESSVDYGTTITLPEKPTKEGYSFDGWSEVPETMPASDVTVYGTFTKLFVETITINDSDNSFSMAENTECGSIYYFRNFNNTEWQTLYVPFDIPYENICEDFEVAEINNVHQYDYDDDGVTDETIIEAFKVASGVLEANYPYLIQAKEAGWKILTMMNTTLYASEEYSIDCSSVREKYTFTGTYNKLKSSKLPQGEGYYTLIDGEWQPVTEDVTLGAFRFYLKVDSRSGAPVAEARSIRMRIIGENGEDDTTEIDNLESTDNDGKTTVIYDLQGRKVLNTETVQEGVYIINGKKVVIK